MKIVTLTAENVKRLSAVTITPDGALVVIGGKNAQGKTSVLDCIEMAFGGKGSVPPEPIRKGQKTAEIVADLGELVVKRTFTKKSSYLSIETADGEKPKAPQEILNDLVGTLSFDPLEFSRMKPEKQSEVLRELVGLDFTVIDHSREKVFNERTIVNREVKALKARLASAEHFPEAPKEEVSVVALAAEAERIRDHNQEGANLATSAENWRTEIDKSQQQIKALKDALALQEEDLETAEKALADQEAAYKEFQPEDENTVREQMAGAEETNRQVRANEARKAITREARAKINEANALTKELEGIDQAKKDTLAGAEMPVDGLGLDEDGQVTFDGLPFEQASSAQQLRVSVAIGLAANPKLPVLLIRDGSLLDEDSLKLLAEMAEAADAQVWLERVGDKDKTAVIIEDGHVREEE